MLEQGIHGVQEGTCGGEKKEFQPNSQKEEGATNRTQNTRGQVRLGQQKKKVPSHWKKKADYGTRKRPKKGCSDEETGGTGRRSIGGKKRRIIVFGRGKGRAWCSLEEKRERGIHRRNVGRFAWKEKRSPSRGKIGQGGEGKRKGEDIHHMEKKRTFPGNRDNARSKKKSNLLSWGVVNPGKREKPLLRPEGKKTLPSWPGGGEKANEFKKP